MCLVRHWRWWLQQWHPGTPPPQLIQGFGSFLHRPGWSFSILSGTPDFDCSSLNKPLAGVERLRIGCKWFSDPDWLQDFELPAILLEPDPSKRGGESRLAAGVWLPQLLWFALFTIDYFLLTVDYFLLTVDQWLQPKLLLRLCPLHSSQLTIYCWLLQKLLYLASLVLLLKAVTTLTGVQNRTTRIGEYGDGQCCRTRCFHGARRIDPREILTGVFS